MSRLILSMNLTLDGYMAGPADDLDWHFRYWNDEMASGMLYLLHESDTLLFGRKTFEGMAAYWQAKTALAAQPEETTTFATSLYNCTKIVFSRQNNLPFWANSRRASATLLRTVHALKAGTGKDILILGSGTLVAPLFKLNLIDVYHLWIHPVILGGGKRLFPGGHFPLHLQCLQSKSLKNGVSRLSLQPAAKADLYAFSSSLAGKHEDQKLC